MRRPWVGGVGVEEVEGGALEDDREITHDVQDETVLDQPSDDENNRDDERKGYQDETGAPRAMVACGRLSRWGRTRVRPLHGLTGTGKADRPIITGGISRGPLWIACCVIVRLRSAARSAVYSRRQGS